MIPSKPLDRAISNIKYRLGKYYVRMGLTHLPKVRLCQLSHVPVDLFRRFATEIGLAGK